MISFDFSGKTAIVTGAGEGIGFEIARRLSLAGASVILNDIRGAVARLATDRITREGGICHPVIGDAGDPDLIGRMADEARSLFGVAEIVVANAGITTFGSFLDYQEADFDRLIQVNLKGSYFLAQRAARDMIEQRIDGRILFLSSVTGIQAHPDLTAYGMTKAALQMLARSLGVELAAHGITVNTIAPGATLTERTLNLDPDYEQVWNRLTPTGQASQPADIAHAAMFLLSPEARQITGQSIVVDGGWTATSPAPPSGSQ